MAQWYSLEGLAARVGLESQAVSVLREGFKRAFGKALAVMGRGGEVNDHFDGALVSKEAAVHFILLKWTGKMGVCSLLTLAPHVAPHVAPDPLVGAPVEEPCLESEIRCDIDHFAGASSVAEGAPVVTADADSYHSQAVARLRATDGCEDDRFFMGGDLLTKSDLKYNMAIRTLVAGIKNVPMQNKLREALDRSPLPRDLDMLALREAIATHSSCCRRSRTAIDEKQGGRSGSVCP